MRTPEQIAAYQKQWRERNKEKRAEYAKKYHAGWYKKNKEKKDKKNQEWDKNNREKRRAIGLASFYRNYDENIKRAGVYRQNNPEKLAETQQLYRSKNKEKVESWHREYNKTVSGLFRRYKSGAKRRKLSFEISEDDFRAFVESNCEYCGADGKTGIDRKDNSIGYEIGNLAPCCHFCNRMKWAHSKEFFLNHIEKIARHNKMV